jgi:hypothetical protein
MIHKSLLAASAVVTLLAISPGAQADDCLFNRTGARVSTAVERTDRVFQRTGRIFQRTGDAIVRTGDRMFGWLRRRTRV